MPTPRTVLLAVSVVIGVLEIADGFRLELAGMAWFFAACSSSARGGCIAPVD